MTALRDRKSQPMPAGTPPLDAAHAAELMSGLAAGWRMAEDGRSLRRAGATKSARTLTFHRQQR